jgi:hypothetical protein
MSCGWFRLVAVLLLIAVLPREMFAQIQSPSRSGGAVVSQLPAITVEATNNPPRARRPPRTHAGNNAQSLRQRSASAPATALASAVSGAPNVGSGPAGQSNMASQITFSGDELNGRPVARLGEILEAVPGLIVTQHSGEGKANQYFLRGYNLDHGTDLAIWVDDVPVNMRTHAHGQGYSDINWLMPETINSLAVRKGPYFADEGDFGSAGNLHISLIDSVPKSIAQVTAGSFGYRRLFGMGSEKIGDGTLLVAGEAGTYNGPWVNPDELRKLNGLMRYTQGTATDGLSVTGMAYSNKWNSTDQVPQRAIASMQIPRLGTEDPTDGGNTDRFALSARVAGTDDA